MHRIIDRHLRYDLLMIDVSSKVLCNDLQASVIESSHDWWAVAQNVKTVFAVGAVCIFFFFSLSLQFH